MGLFHLTSVPVVLMVLCMLSRRKCGAVVRSLLSYCWVEVPLRSVQGMICWWSWNLTHSSLCAAESRVTKGTEGRGNGKKLICLSLVILWKASVSHAVENLGRLERGFVVLLVCLDLKLLPLPTLYTLLSS